MFYFIFGKDLNHILDIKFTEFSLYLIFGKDLDHILDIEIYTIFRNAPWLSSALCDCFLAEAIC